MLSILGVGCSYPEFTIDNALLGKCGLALSDGAGEEILERRSTLTSHYIMATGNDNPKEALAVASERAAELGERAARAALQNAGIEVEQIGLILADCFNPIQLIPSEAQRVAARLNLAVAAYDISGGGAALAVFADLLNRWRSDAVPRYVLCVSCNTPTELISYRSERGAGGAAAHYFGDGAGAVIFSRCEKGKVEVDWCEVKPTPPEERFVMASAGNGHLTLDVERMVKGLERQLRWSLKQREGLGAKGEEAGLFLGGTPLTSLERQLAREYGVRDEQFFSRVKELGWSLGSTTITNLAEHWGRLLDMGYGYVPSLGGALYGALSLRAVRGG